MLVPKGITSQTKALLSLVSLRLLPEGEATLRVQRKTYAHTLRHATSAGSLQEGSRAHLALLSLTQLSSAASFPAGITDGSGCGKAFFFL